MAGVSKPEPRTVLVVEDNPAEVVLTEEAFAELDAGHTLLVARGGDEALRMLRERARRPRSERVDLVLLDLNLPGRDGLSVLRELKSDPELRTTPVLVLSTSTNPRDVEEALALHANAYLAKPLGLQEFLRIIEHVHAFWLVSAARIDD